MNRMDEAYTENSLITKSDMRKTFWRSFPLQGCFNYERMQNVGFCYSMIPVLKRLYPEKEKAREALKRHLSFFNTTPQVVSFITGACVALEEQNKKSEEGFDIESAQTSGMVEILTNSAKIIGLCVVGAMIASMVAFSPPLVLNIGETKVELQGVFDQILPQILPLLLTFGIYGLLKKGYKTVSVMFGIIAAGIICAFLGIL